MSDARRGLPLLSGPPPPSNVSPSDSCRKCGKEFNILFARSRKCNHCGYNYCQSCTDYQALMPRAGPETGYDVMHVCSTCIEHLTITAGGKAYLKSLPLGKLKKYANAYNIKINHAVEKDDVIEALLNARTPHGCLPPENENYYRKYSVPAVTDQQRSGFRNPFRSSQPPQSQTQSTPPRPPARPQQHFPRPDLAPDNPPPPPPRPQPQQYRPPPGPPPPPRPQPQANHYNQYHTPPAGGWGQYPGQSYHQGQYPPYGYQQSPPPPPQSSRPTAPPPPPRPAATRPQPPPPPTLDELLEMSPERVSELGIGALKSILFTNHVNTGQVLEKDELVRKVKTLIEDEKAERERLRQAHELEELERLERERERQEELERERQRREEREQSEREQREREAAEASEQPTGDGAAQATAPMAEEASSPPPPASETPSPKPAPPSTKTSTPSRPVVDRSGLCVICQDEEANIAIVDCGHLAMCRGCSDLVMNSSRECPLCRTRIVTEARLLRIFKT